MPGNILETIDRLKRELDALRPLFFATFILFNNLLIDLLYASLDPRIRYE